MARQAAYHAAVEQEGGDTHLEECHEQPGSKAASCEELKGHIFDCAGYNQLDQFVKTKEQVAIYVGSNYKHGGTMAKGAKDLMVPTITYPTAPAGYALGTADATAKYVWETEMKEAIRDKKEIEAGIQKLYSVVLGTYSRQICLLLS